MARYDYQIFIPGGNKTALVYGLENDVNLCKTIQDKIIAEHQHDPDGEVEQVGFVSTDKSKPQLTMTGGEFCGNATRSAAVYYLDGRLGQVEIVVSGVAEPLAAGIGTGGEVWAQMPVYDDVAYCVLQTKRSGLYWVMIEGISHLIVPQLQALPYLTKIYECNNADAQKEIALSLLHKTISEYSLPSDCSYGVIFLENIADVIKMHPFVHVCKSDTTYYETGCGSGAICVGLVSSLLRGEDVCLPLLQPSGKIIRAEVACVDGTMKGKISGEVERGEVWAVEV
ncbi:MAG: hypothetical protein FWE32_08490 [Oscillospiraceae bacterium]|nr:hypothetical protein [Oscillospiraceae bacterium]